MRIAITLALSALVTFGAHASPMTAKDYETTIKASATFVTLCESTGEQQMKIKVAATMAIMELIKITGEQPMDVSNRLGEQIVPEILTIKSDPDKRLEFCNKTRREL